MLYMIGHRLTHSSQMDGQSLDIGFSVMSSLGPSYGTGSLVGSRSFFRYSLL